MSATSAVTAPAATQSADARLVAQWLTRFEAELQRGDARALTALFAGEDSHWRDVLAFTWHITAVDGADKVGAALAASQKDAQARGFAIAEGRTPPRRVVRTGYNVIEAIVRFETATGRAFGVVRLLADNPAQAFQLMTNLHELKGFEEKIGRSRPSGEAYSRNFGGTNWKDQREAALAYADREPTVLIVGGGQAGLTLAARLNQLHVDALVVDQHERVGDCWRKRYHSLALHNHTDVNHLPYLPFPETFPRYIPKDMLGDWFESYCSALEINFWTSTKFVSGSYDAAKGTWNALVRRRDGSERVLHPRHLVFANGIIGHPRIPELPGLDSFRGDVMHTSQYSNGVHWRGKKALVLGTGTSGHDVAQDLHSNGVDTTIIQRGSTTVVSINPSAKLVYGIYDDGTPLEDADLLVATNTLPVTVRNLQKLTARMVELDKKLIEGLVARGFKYDIGPENAGHQMKVRTRSGGYYLNAGCSELIISGDIGLMQFDTIEKFVPEGALLKDGSVKKADLLVMATGFYNHQALLSEMLGTEMVQKVGRIWGPGPDGELNNMWKRTAQEGLWFIGGGFTNCRVYSRTVSLQIKAIEEGLIPKARPAA